jgi:hypothetical protein
MINLIRVQTLGKFNERLSNEWTPILEKIDKKIKFCCDNELFTLPYVQIKYNNNIIDTKIIFKDVKEISSFVMDPSQKVKQLVFEKNFQSLDFNPFLSLNNNLNLHI